MKYFTILITALSSILLTFPANLPAADLVLMSKDSAPLPIILAKDAAPHLP